MKFFIIKTIAVFCLLGTLFSGVYAQDSKEELNLRIIVTGSPATAAHIREVVLNHFYRQGYAVDILSRESLKSLHPGQSLSLEVGLLKLEDEKAGSESKKENSENNNEKEKESSSTMVKTLHIINEYAPIIPCEMLVFSNHPEKISERGLLFQAGLIRHKPVRLRYYHQADKAFSQNIYAGFYLVNYSNRPAVVKMIEAVGGPSADVMMAGHMNNLKFFHKRQYDQGWIEEIPPNSVVTVRRTLLKPEEVISATMDLHLLQGGPLQIITYASLEDDSDLAAALLSCERDPHVRGAYPITNIYTESVFSVDQGEIFHTIADTPIGSILEGRPIRGNYGVMYEYNFTLKNPYAEERTVSFFFQPRGGIATATFSFDDRPVSIGFTRAYDMIRLCSITIPPKGKKAVNVKTMPEDASNYPVRLILQGGR